MAKTGTTSLQQNVFARHSEIAYIGLPCDNAELEWAIRSISRDDSTTYNPDRVEGVFHNWLANVPEDKVVVYSDESLALYESTDKGIIAHRLYDIFPSARIMFTLRRQDDLLRSYYLQRLNRYLKGNHYISFDLWFSLKQKQSHNSIFSDIDFFPTLSFYSNVFGEDSVDVFLYEDLQRNRDEFCDSMARFIGVDASEFQDLMSADSINVSMSSRQVMFVRSAGWLVTRRFARWLLRRLPRGKVGSADIKFDLAKIDHLRDICGEGNRKIVGRYGIDLKSRGYIVAGCAAEIPRQIQCADE
jgi:hypothetical protein